MKFNQINNSESGLTVRGKLNSMLSALIEGVEGVGAIWTALFSMVSLFTLRRSATTAQQKSATW